MPINLTYKFGNAWSSSFESFFLKENAYMKGLVHFEILDSLLHSIEKIFSGKIELEEKREEQSYGP